MPNNALSQPAPRSDGAEAAARGDTILLHARQAFVEKGFDGASMQDLARAAGMSAGNFYRYFPSKAAIVEALIERDLLEIEESFQAILASPDPLAALKAALREQMNQHCSGDDGQLWGEIAATAARKPEVAAILARMEDGITRRVALVLARAGEVPEAEAEERFGLCARLIFLIMHGAMTAHTTRDQPRDGALISLVLRTIDRIMDDAITELKDC